MNRHPCGRWLRTLLVLGAAELAPERAAAQRAGTVVSVAAGAATDERGTHANAVTVSPTVSLVRRQHLDLQLSGSATRFMGSAWQAGGAVTVAARSNEVRGTAVSLNAGVGVSRSSFGTTFTVTDATPAVEFAVGPLTLFGGGHLASARTIVRSAPTPIPTPGQQPLAARSRASAGPVYGAQWIFGGAPVSAALSFRGEHARLAGETVMDRSTGAVVALGPVSLGATFADRASVSERASFASGTVAIGLARNVTLDGAAGQYPSNRLTGTAGGRFVSAGFSFRFGASDGGPTLPTPSGVRAPPRGVTRLSIRSADARSVELYGDWNGWTPVAAQRAANGVWFVDLSLEPGEYRYAFRINAIEWRVPDGAATTPDGFGGKSAYVTVPRAAAHVGSNSREER